MDEIRDLKDELELSRSASQSNAKTNDAEVGENHFELISAYSLRQDARWRSMFEDEQAEVQSLRMALDERSAELDSLRKKLNREVSMNSIHEPTKSPSKHESEEIKGLKYDA